MPKESTFLVQVDGGDFVVGTLRLKAGHVPTSNQRLVREADFTQMRRGAERLSVVKSNYKLPRWKVVGSDIEDQTSLDTRPTAAWVQTEVNVRLNASNVVVELKIDGPLDVTELSFNGEAAFTVVLQLDGAGKRKWLMDVDTSAQARYRLDNCTEVRMTNGLMVTVT